MTRKWQVKLAEQRCIAFQSPGKDPAAEFKIDSKPGVSECVALGLDAPHVVIANEVHLNLPRRLQGDYLAIRSQYAAEAEAAFLAAWGKFAASGKTLAEWVQGGDDFVVLEAEEPPRRGVGRPETVRGVSVSIYLDATRREIALRLGKGNVSDGIRQALDIANRKQV